jgi:hypothetical protein
MGFRAYLKLIKIIRHGRARRGASGALNLQSATAGLNSFSEASLF